LLLLLGLSGCDGQELIHGPELDAVKKLRTGEYQLMKSDELAQLRRDAELGRSVGRFHQYTHGYRTWRLDTATGQNCLLLATDADWKKPETSAQVCQQ